MEKSCLERWKSVGNGAEPCGTPFVYLPIKELKPLNLSSHEYPLNDQPAIYEMYSHVGPEGLLYCLLMFMVASSVLLACFGALMFSSSVCVQCCKKCGGGLLSSNQ